MPETPLQKARRNVNWCRLTLKKLVDNPRLMKDEECLQGTLRSIIQSLDVDNNPLMKALNVEEAQQSEG